MALPSKQSFLNHQNFKNKRRPSEVPVVNTVLSRILPPRPPPLAPPPHTYCLASPCSAALGPRLPLPSALLASPLSLKVWGSQLTPDAALIRAPRPCALARPIYSWEESPNIHSAWRTASCLEPLRMATGHS